MGLALNVPALNTLPAGVKLSIISALPATAPIGKPPPMILPSVVMSG